VSDLQIPQYHLVEKFRQARIAQTQIVRPRIDFKSECRLSRQNGAALAQALWRAKQLGNASALGSGLAGTTDNSGND